MSLRAAYIAVARRTPIARHYGALAGIRSDDLAAVSIRAVIDASGIDPAAVDEVLFGCANQAGEDNRNVARMAWLLAGYPDSVSAATVNRLCGSSLESINQGARMIVTGEADLVVAGGVEHMTRAPWVMGKPVDGKPRGNQTLYDSSLGWRFPNPRLEARFPLEAMGETAENVAERWHIGREAQDLYAVESHRRAVAAQDAGVFAAELCPVALPTQKGKPDEHVGADEQPRRDCTPQALQKLKPAFRTGGSVTAGNSSSLNDGAAAVLIASEGALRTHGLTPLARWVGGAAAGIDPRIMGVGPVPATRKLLTRTGLSVADLDRIELNEAFAAQALAVMADLELDPARVNPTGGAIALGHPLGASGARIVATLLHGMQRDRQRYGLATMCIGVGQGIATLFEAS